MRLLRGHKPSGSGWDMTPMIDVVLQLIIFFMFTSQFGSAIRTEVELPPEAGEQSDAVERGAIVIDIAADGTISVEARPMTAESAAIVVARELDRADGDPSKVPVIVRADRRGAASSLNALAQALSDTGLRSWRLATAPGGDR